MKNNFVPLLKSKRALVTGGSRGIGAAIVRRLAEAGADVAFTYVKSLAQAETLVASVRAGGGRVLAIQSDSADAAALQAAVDHAARELGGLDILVNNAGVFLMGPADTFSLADFDRTIAVNVRAVFVATQAALRHLPAGGRIINISSCNADRMPVAGGGVYAMSKAALQGLVQGFARDLGPRGITINNVQPGPVDTDMNPASGDFAAVLIKQFMAIPRYGTGAEIAEFVTFLSGPHASYITGANLTIDGGFSA
ncbi:MAG: SDR family oxidoreductase [Verrucomicrobia bacterium]|nr:SDR family oxidoreductase [Verrucomicrobiota bacterium]